MEQLSREVKALCNRLDDRNSLETKRNIFREIEEKTARILEIRRETFQCLAVNEAAARELNILRQSRSH